MKKHDITVKVALGVALGLLLGAGCAGSKRKPRDPEACMHACEQERCEYVPDGLGDNTPYIDCLRDCEKRCGG
jgi:hypothetical protein